MNEVEQPLVSIYMTAYNHERYIAQAIEGVLMQQTDFKYMLFIGEDCSTDNTREICIEYERKYPKKIKLICTEKNNMIQNERNVWDACYNCGAKFIATCEGDDYWTDPLKLKKQVDFLESNNDFTFCFAKVDILDELGWNWNNEKFLPRLTREVYSIEDFILSDMNMVPTPTLLFKVCIPFPLPEFYYIAKSGDLVLQLLLGDRGKARYFDEVMAVYRNHSGGITKSKENIEKGESALMKLYEDADIYFNNKYHSVIMKKLKNIAIYRLMRGSREKVGVAKVKHYFKTIPEYYKFSDSFNIKDFLYYHIMYFFPRLLKIKKIA